ncbi:hypothetical protein R5W23_004888 [Gemmata sp. JC673]|uniref:Uncharacterized protein n=1 Tax=Gemmata algarum TaxID=2975278 RepID=A0ABU5F9H9_9BACT|nr:hypothetical protein [Gemmata algarum]MDY3563385.1 hypothetical protein [Gemmata algarum]
MGSVRLGRLPDTKPWRQVVAHIAGGDSAAVVAGAVSHAAVQGLERGVWDPGVSRVVFLLARTAVAARAADFVAALAEIDVRVPDAPDLFDLTVGLTAAVQDWHTAHPGRRTDLGEMAALAAAECLTALVGDRTAELFATGERVRNAVRDFATENGFKALGHDYFARFVRRFLLYHLGRELSQHVGGAGRFADHSAHAQFVADLDTHCREAAAVVHTFAGEWYNKSRSRFLGGVTERQAAGFTARCLEKLRGELHRRGTRGG